MLNIVIHVNVRDLCLHWLHYIHGSLQNVPWSRLHVDYAGPVNGKMLFIIVDSHTKWIDAHVTSGCTSTITINKLRESFSTYGIPDTIVSDNATCFMSSEFQEFCKHSGIRHITSAPHHPSSNGTGRKSRTDSQVWIETYG